MSKWLSTSITLIANSLHRNRSFWTERKNFIVWVKRTHLDHLIEWLRARMREKYFPTHFKSWHWRYVSNRTPIKCPQLQTRYVWSLFWQRLYQFTSKSCGVRCELLPWFLRPNHGYMQSFSRKTACAYGKYEQEIGFIFREPEETGRKKRNASARKRQVANWTLKTGETK